MIEKIIEGIVLIVIISIVIKVFGKLIDIDERNEQICAEQGMVYVTPRGAKGYCTEGFRP